MTQSKFFSITAVFIICSFTAACALNNGLALTPPMGWNSWNKLRQEGVTEKNIKAIADAMVISGMKDAGYQFVCIDVGWWGSNRAGGRDAQGNILCDPAKFPNGMKVVVDYIHEKGLKAGIYTDIGNSGCNVAYGSFGHFGQDTRQFADWGFDYIKVDACGGANGVSNQVRYQQFRDSLLACGRPTVFSICEWGSQTPWVWGPATGNLWRVGLDIDMQGSIWNGVLYELDRAVQHADAAGPGAWNDPDMLEVGNNLLTVNEERAHFSLWCILAAPLIAGNDVRTMSADVKSILTNAEAIAVNQDSLGVQGKKISDDGNHQVFVKPLRDSSKAVVLFNKGSSSASMTVNWSAIGISGTAHVADIWQHKNIGDFTGSYSATVAGHDAAMVRIYSGPTVAAGWMATGPAKVSVTQSERICMVANGLFIVPAEFSNRKISVVVYSVSGKRLAVTEGKNKINLRKEFGVSGGVCVTRYSLSSSGPD